MYYLEITEDKNHYFHKELNFDEIKDSSEVFHIDDSDKDNFKKIKIDFLLQKKKKELDKAIQKTLDQKAQELRYDNIMSARSYAGYENPFQAEAQKLALWASNCWVKAAEIEVVVKAGKREMPTIDEVLAELPAYK